MKLFYIANIRFPTERAHGIQVAHMCSAFARTQIRADKEDADVRRFPEVTLLVPDRKTFSEDPFEYYGVDRNFAIEKIPVPDIVRFGQRSAGAVKIGLVTFCVFAGVSALDAVAFWPVVAERLSRFF